MKVFVYYNLHTHKWSLKALEGEHKGKVIAHCTAVWLQNCQLKVSEAGRQRVLREQKKNVHAGVAGELLVMINGRFRLPCGYLDHLNHETTHKWIPETGVYPGWEAATYNPYKYESFVTLPDEQRIDSANYALLEDRKVFILQ